MARTVERLDRVVRGLDLIRYQAARKRPGRWKPPIYEHPDRPGVARPKALPVAQGLSTLMKKLRG